MYNGIRKGRITKPRLFVAAIGDRARGVFGRLAKRCVPWFCGSAVLGSVVLGSVVLGSGFWVLRFCGSGFYGSGFYGSSINEVCMPITADLIITNAHGITMDPENPTAEALAIRGNRIIFVGTHAGAMLVRGPTTRLIDAGGATLMPGIIDSHYHLLLGSLRLDGIQLGGCRRFEQIRDTIRLYAAEHPKPQWLAGSGLLYGMASTGGELSRHDLDAVVADRPILLIAFDGHTAFANTKALELAGCFTGYDCGPNSEIVRDQHGLPTGELREPGAFRPLQAFIPKPDAARKRQLLQQGLAQASRLGITSIHNMDGNAERLQFYQAAEQNGDLTLRVYVPFDITPTTVPDAIAEAVMMRETARGPRVRAGAVKFFMDGVIEGYTGLLLQPYAEQATSGEANFSAEQFAELASTADQLGLQIFVHAIGDLAVRRTLDGFAEAQLRNGKRDARHRIEHIELIDYTDLGRFAELGVIASMQPYHAPIPPDYGTIWCQRVGPERWQRSFAWRSILAAGARLAFGSDWPVVSQNPWVGIDAAINRTAWHADMPTEAISLVDALAAYTTGAAYAEFEEQRKGMLRVGMLADLVLLDRDLMAMPKTEIQQLQVQLTICDGRIVFEA
jgi:predicted amidohydrolase YtcJ